MIYLTPIFMKISYFSLFSSLFFRNFATKLTIMSRNKKKLPILENVSITAVAAEGKALARVDDKVVFVPFVVPGDVVDLQVKKKKPKTLLKS